MYYKAKFLVLGKPPAEETISGAFEGAERVDGTRAIIKETADISFGNPEDQMKEPPDMEEDYDDILYDGILDPGWGYLFFETPEEYEPETVVEIVDEGMDKLDVPVELRYIDANTEAFSDK